MCLHSFATRPVDKSLLIFLAHRRGTCKICPQIRRETSQTRSVKSTMQRCSWSNRGPDEPHMRTPSNSANTNIPTQHSAPDILLMLPAVLRAALGLLPIEIASEMSAMLLEKAAAAPAYPRPAYTGAGAAILYSVVWILMGCRAHVSQCRSQGLYLKMLTRTGDASPSLNSSTANTKCF